MTTRPEYAVACILVSLSVCNCSSIYQEALGTYKLWIHTLLETMSVLLPHLEVLYSHFDCREILDNNYRLT